MSKIISTGHGNTPIIFVGTHRGIKIYLKLEGENPSGALKDRLVSWVMSHTPESQWSDKILLDASSGSHGFALALWGARNSVPVTIVSNVKISEENRRAILATGATFHLEGKITKESRDYCLRLNEESPDDYFFFDQLEQNAAYPAYHAIAKEILRDLPQTGTIVASKGSGVTLRGICDALRNEPVKVFGTIGFTGDQSIVGTYKPGADYETDAIRHLVTQTNYLGDIPVHFESVMTTWKKLLSKGFLVGPQGAGVYQSIITLIDQGRIKESVVGVAGDTALKHLSRLG